MSQRFSLERIEGKGCVVQFCHETVSRGHYFKSFCRQITQVSELRSMIEMVNSSASDTNKLNNYFNYSQHFETLTSNYLSVF